MKYLLVIPILILSAVTLTAQSNPALRDELLKMRNADQAARDDCNKEKGDTQIKCYVKISETIDTPNTKRIEEIFDRSGFPTAKTVGIDGIEAFLLILQHAPGETLRRKCLKPVKKAFKRKEITPSEYANYVDRLLVRQNKPQIYGTNFDFKDDKLVMSKTRDLKNLDRRRQKLGLPPIKEYAQMLKEMYHQEVEIPAR